MFERGVREYYPLRRITQNQRCSNAVSIMTRTPTGTETTGSSNQMLYFHDIKTNESKLVYKTPEHPKWMHSGEVSDDGKWLLVTTNESCDPVNSVYLQNIESGELKKIVDNFESEYGYLTNIGNVFYFKTNLDATRNRIISIDIETLKIVEVVKETSDVLESCGVMKGEDDIELVELLLSQGADPSMKEDDEDGILLVLVYVVFECLVRGYFSLNVFQSFHTFMF